MRYELDHRTGMMVPKRNENIYISPSMGGGLLVDDEKHRLRYLINRNGTITMLFGGDRICAYDTRDAVMIANRVKRTFGDGHPYSDYRKFINRRY